MLFMKGNPDNPQCGFSSKTVDIIRSTGIDNFGYFDILQDSDIREGLKIFSNWPTYPQLYVNRELIGRYDIITELSEDDDLSDVLAGA